MPNLQTSLGQVTVVRAQRADVDAVLAILTEAAEWLTARGIDQWQPGRFSRERGAAAIDRGEVYVATVQGEPVATLRLQWSDEQIWGVTPEDAGYVHALAVGRAYAGHRIGLGLLRWAEHPVATVGRKFLRLDCMAANHALRKYYLQAGFTFRGEAHKHGWHCALFEREVGDATRNEAVETFAEDSSSGLA